MSWTQATEPVCTTSTATSVIETTIAGRPRDLGGFAVRRVLPAAGHRLVGPFIFFDHIGPATFAPGTGMDVRRHPHINLATVTYLFEGEILHRDSLGSEQVYERRSDLPNLLLDQEFRDAIHSRQEVWRSLVGLAQRHISARTIRVASLLTPTGSSEGMKWLRQRLEWLER